MPYFVYSIYNHRHDKIYVGQTVDLIARLNQHNDSSFPKYTSRYDGNWVLIHQESFLFREEAVIREKQLKSYQGRKFLKNKKIPG